ncbi:carboxypeptidase-like protein [Larkinella arboricola]|uniref:Carboxypeptidase-like protein n=1 Tax=Larkinella arboricola TaxID=643671 RepID=A0A327WTT8_LARAB|nr:carboxypeptidase-like regulatory domain-containing protein [Larkinella arboricola]RAJ95744.1 carboxypeptidase-like protein [Larkinella arboricola]
MPYSAHLLYRFLVGLFLTLFTLFVRAQPGSLTLAGKVVNQTTGDPIPSANITIVGRTVGTVTNEKGAFRLTIPTVSASDSLRVSSIGFRSATRKIPATGRQNLTIRLKPAAVKLDEVRVQARRKTAVDILREAVAAIPRNYDTTSRQLTAFYREDQQFGAKPVVSSEAVLSVYKAAYNQSEINDGLKLLKGRKKEYDRATHQLPLIINLSNGARTSLLYGDFVKRAFDKRNTINERNYKYYDFTLSTFKGDRLMYVIDVKPGKRKRKAFGVGKLYIDAQTMAFVRSEFQLTQAGIDAENNRQWLLKKLASAVHRMNLKFTGLKEVVTYSQPEGPGGSGQWNLSHVERQYSFQIDSKSRNLIEKPWEVSTRFTITDVGPKGVSPFTEGNLAENQSPFSSLISNQSNLDLGESDHIPQRTVTDPVLPEPPRAVSKPDSVKKQIRNPVGDPVGNRQNGFTRADTLRGKLTPLRSSYDVTFYDLAVKVDIGNKTISGKNRMRFRVLTPLDKLQVDLYANMQIHQIRHAGKPLRYTREFNGVFVEFPETLKAGREHELEIDYSGKPQVPYFSVPMMGGFLWEKDRAGKPWVQVVCQGSGASLWWPNKDHLSDEPDSMRISVTVPDGLMSISNGRLRRKTVLPGNWTQYDWYVSYPINNYNVTLNIGNYAHRRETYGPDSLTLDYYCMPYNQEKFRWVFDGVKPMLATLEKHYGKYPFPRDGFTLMESLYPMEHQSAVSFGKLPTSRADSLTATDSLSLMQLVWHEVSHEWWGNNVSCRDLADLWIHEAFATYSEGFLLDSVVNEDGELGYIASLSPQVIGREPIIGVRDVNHIHYEIGDMYAKGALVLYTFRHALQNDTLWAAILKGIQQRFRLQTVTSKDIIGYINEITGTDYTSFFDQYLNHATIPTLQVKLVEKGSSLMVQYRWKADEPNFRMPILVTQKPDQFEFITPTNDWQTMTLPNMTADDFEVDEIRFYVNVEEIEPEFLKQ